MTELQKAERDAAKHAAQIIVEAHRLGMSGHESSWKQLRKMAEVAWQAAFEAGRSAREPELRELQGKYDRLKEAYDFKERLDLMRDTPDNNGFGGHR